MIRIDTHISAHHRPPVRFEPRPRVQAPVEVARNFVPPFDVYLREQNAQARAAKGKLLDILA